MKGDKKMKEDEELMTAEEFFGTEKSEKGANCASGLRQKKRRENKTFSDIKARMVMRIYRVTRAKAEKIISERAAAKTEAGAAAKAAGAAKDCGLGDVDLMSAEEFFRG